jgi:hypothetical protein
MKRTIARTTSILGFLAALAGPADIAWAAGGARSIPSCRPRPTAVSAEPAAGTADLTVVLLQMWASCLYL